MHKRSTTSGSFRVRAGFTLLELLIVLMIFTVVTALFIANYRRFGNNVTLSNVADEVALSIREMQTYGLASKRSTLSPGEPTFKKAFGIYVQGSGGYLMFEDINDSRKYESGESVAEYRLPADITISDRCVNVSTSALPATDHELHISFKRPDPDAKIYYNNTEYTSAGMCLKSGQTGKQKTVVVLQSGQIEVLDDCTC